MNGGAGAPRARLSAVAVAGAVLGLLWLGGLGSILAVTFGIIGLVETRSPRRRGRAVAVVALVVGVVGILATLIVLLVASVPDRSGRPRSSVRPSATTSAPAGATSLRPIPAADQARCTAEVQLLEFGAQTYEALNSRYPTTLAEIGGVGIGVDRISLYAIDPAGGATSFRLVPTAEGRAIGCAPH